MVGTGRYFTSPADFRQGRGTSSLAFDIHLFFLSRVNVYSARMFADRPALHGA